MIIDVNKNSVSEIKNVYLLFHVVPGLLIFEDFKQMVRRTGVEITEEPYQDEVGRRIERLREKGARLRNADKSIYVNRLSPACALCDKGEGAITVDISHNCNRRCYHCFGDTSKIPPGQVYDYLGTLDYFGRQSGIKSMGLSGGEPLLYKEDAVSCLGYVHEKFPDAYKRLYTNGDFLDLDILKKLHDVSLDEIRLSIKHSDFDDWSELKSKMILAKEHVPNVMVEMPVMPGTLERMKEILVQLDRMDIFGINLCEFCYCMHHADEFNKRSYKVKFPPFRIPFFSRNQYPGIPVAGSDLESYDLLEFSIDQGLKMGVHYCSLENRLSSPVYELNHGQTGDSMDHFSRRDFFIKSAMACGEEDIARVLKIFRDRGISEFRVIDGRARYVEFHVDKIALLKDLDIELGIVSSVVENDTRANPFIRGASPGPGVGSAQRKQKRAVKIDLTYPKIFDFENDV